MEKIRTYTEGHREGTERHRVMSRCGDLAPPGGGGR